MIPEYAYFIGSLIAAIAIWFIAMITIRFESFNSCGCRKIPLPTTNEILLSEELRKHGEGVYKDLDLFFKLSLAIFGGIAVLLLTNYPEDKLPLVKGLIEFGRWLQLFAAVFTAIFVISHKRSSVLRWKKRFPWWHVIYWGETWGFISGMAITFYFFFVASPLLITLSGIA